ncbi:hypothetical protein [Alkalicoccobacillus porphyridii]|uniref:Uncharacterized protein n=1 Tax=Alkalicoccobacillus porphyridii TaxID=2597270 RepID=A0A553ZV35_9BACI|nr:hypothetical protein [Alkalicoccobacillus porphyridii]TSB45350.1 hypothetical protein FN960_16775 [Alkalicoccobacillus porphyridii]
MYHIIRSINGNEEALRDSNSPTIKVFETLLDAELMASKLNRNSLANHTWTVQLVEEPENDATTS